MRKFLFLVAFAPIVSIAAPQRIAPPVERVEEIRQYFIKPAIGAVASAEVGDSLYQEGIRTVSKHFRAVLKTAAESKMDNGYVLSVPAGSEGQMMMRRDGTPLLCFMTRPTGMLGFFGDANVVGCLVDSDRKQVFDFSTFEQYDRYFMLSQHVPYDVATTETTVERKDDFYVDVLYQGMSKGEVKISYREFSNGLARPAFTQEISYELEPNGTGIIGFKGLRIKVLKATGHSLDYVLEQPMPSLTKYRAVVPPAVTQ